MGRSRIVQIIIALASLVLVACNDKFMAQSARSKTSALAAISSTVDEAGNISGNIDPNASATQLLKFNSGELAGSAIAIPPGALSIPVAVTVGAGESLSSSQFLQDVGITNNSISAAGPSVAFTPSQPIQATNPLTLSIPFSSGSALSLTASNDNIVVLYRWTKVVNGESSHSMGIIPAKDVVIAKDKVSFQTTMFGVFQVGRAETKIAERINVQSLQPPVPKKDLSNPLVGTWGTCEVSGNRDNYSEPVFLKPRWSSVSVDSSGTASLGLRGKAEPLIIERRNQSDCSGSVSSNLAPIAKGFLAIASNLREPAYFLIKDSAGNGSDSCQAVYPVKGFIDVTHARRYFGVPSGGVSPQRLSVQWRGSSRQYTFEAFANATCQQTALKSETVTSTSDFVQVDFDWAVAMTSPASFKITDQNDPTNVSECMGLPHVNMPPDKVALNQSISPPASPTITVGDLSVDQSNSGGNFRFNWWRSGSLENQAYKLEFFTDNRCETVNNNQMAISTAVSEMNLILDNNTTSIKISDISVGDGVVQASHVCIKTARLSSFQIPAFTRYNAGVRWIGLSWRSSQAVELLQFAGKDCASGQKVVTLNQPSGAQQQTWADINNLNPNTTYSFKLRARTMSSECQNIMTTSADVPDWSSGNKQEWNGGDVSFRVNANVRDRSQYKLRASINGRPPVETYSVPITTGDTLELARIPATVANDNIITVWTPAGCTFVDSDGRRYPALSLPTHQMSPNAVSDTSVLPTVVCDGASNNDGGGGDSFGGYPTMKLASKGVNLKITNGAFTMIEDLYESTNCAVDTRISSRVELGALNLPGLDSLKDTVPIDVTSRELSGVIFTDQGVRAAKTDPNRFGCGIREWIKGQRANLRDSSCGNEIGRTKYERLKIVGDRLYICEIPGDEEAYGKTPDMRIPSCEINEQSFFLKRQ